MTRTPNKLIPDDFTATPSLDVETVIEVVGEIGSVDALGVLVHADGDLPAGLDLDRESLARAGFEGKAGQTLVLPLASGPLFVVVGGGARDEQTDASLRDAVAAFSRATSRFASIGFQVGSLGDVDEAAAVRALVEGAVLARYRFTELKKKRPEKNLERLELLIDGIDGSASSAVAEGVVSARAATIARDLCNTPPGHLTATDFADAATVLGERFGFAVEVFDKAALIELGTGGLLGVNAGSAEEPRMIKLTYTPEGDATGHLGLVGKGIMYDSGGISLKPSDPMHLLMKMDMGGAAAVLGAFSALRDLGATAKVTGWLMCTDNMPSGSAMQLGDVLTARGGTTVEVKNTDAEGRLVMMDALVLATEDGVDAVVDIATLTGAALMALGQLTAALFGNNQELVEKVKTAASGVDEQVWQLPLEKKYRKQLDSDIADISNIGGSRYAGATTAALFLNDFVGETPWAHLDIAGTMQSDSDDAWRSKGATGFGARTLLGLARDFTA
ncbi:leucyl aminopeptidase [Agromyces atrinae]|uniref:Probable cytosol aminopeptidase n=1 Tax=Agromyces atrinae TaxID=592376 RepID=A0A4Q2M758_9MICO|nr:leucyl aminopeptidase [Agromyces atrinae]NYD67747.1 leucyl aminopeptidase [Agromyces atrinae]RXZ88064.1 leucyl aminopeptidase [Agromyces atrinae]